MVKNSPDNVGDMVLSLGQEDPLEKEVATHSSMEKSTDREACGL